MAAASEKAASATADSSAEKPPRRSGRLRLWGFIAVTVLTIFTCLGLLGLVWMHGSAEGKHALEDGRKIRILLESGEITGHVESSVNPPAPTAAAKPETPAPTPAPAPAAVPETPVAEKPAPETPAVKTPPKEHAAAPTTATKSPAIDMTPVEVPVVPVGDTKEDEALKPDGESLTSAPAPEVTEHTGNGDLPIIAKNGDTPLLIYARPFKHEHGTALVALIITGLGHNKDSAEAAAKLPPDITLSFSPYAKLSPAWVLSSRALGHEVLVDLPVEPEDYPASDPGPKAMLTTNADEENNNRLLWVLSRFPGIIGVFTTPKEKFTTQKDNYFPVLKEISKRGLMHIIGNPNEAPDIHQIQESSHAVYMHADLVVDDDITAEGIARKLAELEDIARKRGQAIGIANAYPITLQQIGKWAQHMNGHGIALAPVSALAPK